MRAQPRPQSVQAEICLCTLSSCWHVPFAVCSLLWNVVCELFLPSLSTTPAHCLPCSPIFLFSLLFCSLFLHWLWPSVTMQRASLGRALVSIATVQKPIPQWGSRLRFGATPLVPCPLCIPAKPHLPLSRGGTDINRGEIVEITCHARVIWLPRLGGLPHSAAFT